MSNRLQSRLGAMQRRGEKAFVVYLPAGDPDLATTEKLLPALEQAGADVIELGVPFSDPMADGAANQAAAERGLASGTTVAGIIAMVARVRAAGCDVPIMLFTYLNPILAYGSERFATDAAAAGIDGILALDLPVGADDQHLKIWRQGGLATVCLIAPNTAPERRAKIAKASRGFVYYVCRFGVTGEQNELPTDLQEKVNELQNHAKAPIYIGFGISTPEQAAAAASAGDGCIVGSHLVRILPNTVVALTLLIV